ncbi:MAG: 8-amino-7-oxononanoate synthase [Candidatus Sumerlaeia bacterium]
MSNDWIRIILDDYEGELTALEQAGRLRHLRHLERSGPVHARLADGRQLLVMCANDYLGLAMNARLVAAVQEGVERWGAGAGASRLVCGSLNVHHEAEEALARWKGSEAALLFGAGYLANLGIIGALVGRGDAVFCDRLNHASLIDGVRSSGAALIPYRHGDADHLAHLLSRRRGRYRRALIATDSVFSMDGDVAPLGDLLGLAERYGAILLADEAHAMGVLGEQGRGAVEMLGLPCAHPLLIQMGTLSKAAGLYGAYVCAVRRLIEMLVNRARSFIYSTAPPPAIAHAVPAALQLIAEAGPARARLRMLGGRLFEGLRSQGWNASWHGTPIVPVMLGAEESALDLQDRLLKQGLLAVAIRPPSVPPGESRVRLTVSAAHTTADIETALAAFQAGGAAHSM